MMDAVTAMKQAIDTFRRIAILIPSDDTQVADVITSLSAAIDAHEKLETVGVLYVRQLGMVSVPPMDVGDYYIVSKVE